MHILQSLCIAVFLSLFRHNKIPKVFCLTFGVHVTNGISPNFYSSKKALSDTNKNNPVRVIDIVIDELKLDNFKKLYKETGRCAYDAQGYNLRLHEQPLL